MEKNLCFVISWCLQQRKYSYTEELSPWFSASLPCRELHIQSHHRIIFRTSTVHFTLQWILEQWGFYRAPKTTTAAAWTTSHKAKRRNQEVSTLWAIFLTNRSRSVSKAGATVLQQQLPRGHVWGYSLWTALCINYAPKELPDVQWMW